MGHPTGGYLRGMERAPRITWSGRGHVHTLRRIVQLKPLIVLAAVVGLGLVPTTAASTINGLSCTILLSV